MAGFVVAVVAVGLVAADPASAAGWEDIAD